MTSTDKEFAGSIPEIYDRYLVPLIFAPYAADLASRVAAQDPKSVLETAAGTGVVTRAVAARLPAATRIVATDLNQPMLDQAKGWLAADGRITCQITWQQADALTLPFDDASFDAVVCQFGVMFFPDKVKGYAEARRVLKPHGRFIFNVWDQLSENEFAETVTEALATMFPDDPPRFLARTPHGHSDAERICANLKEAGFEGVSADIVGHVGRAASARDPAVGYCQGTPLRGEIEARDPSGLEDATRCAATAIARRFGAGPVEGRIRALVFTASRQNRHVAA